jgi:cellulose synthase operon protein YhjQ
VTHYVVVASPKGGVGRTTLVAQLAARLTELGRRCLAVDLDPQNALSLQLSSHPGAWVSASRQPLQSVGLTRSVGIVQPELTSTLLAEHLRARRAQIAHVPFGTHDSRERRRAERDLAADPRRLRERIAGLVPPRCELVLIDTPAGSNPWSEAALDMAEFVLVPIIADPACIAALPGYETYLSQHAGAAYPERVRYVVNLWNPLSQLACDVFDLLRDSLGDRLLSQAVHEDELVREQLARGSPLTLEAGSQAAADLSALTSFMLQELDNPDVPSLPAHAS